MADAVGHDLHLPGRAEKAAVYGVKAQPQFFPVTEKIRHMVGQIGKAKIGKAAGARGQHGRGQRADLDAQGGKNGDNHHERRAAESGQVMNGGNTGSTEIHADMFL